NAPEENSSEENDPGEEKGISTFSYEPAEEEIDKQPEMKVNLSKDSGPEESDEGEDKPSSSARPDSGQGETGEKENTTGGFFGGFGAAFVSNRPSPDENNKVNGFMGASDSFNENKAASKDDLNKTMFIFDKWDSGKEEDDLNKTMYIQDTQRNEAGTPGTCPFCGEVLEEESTFCYMCGKRLKP
nr:hypothetical protein [Lachnospiraceae bacterium]